MTRFKRFIMWIVLVLISLLIILSIYGAFIGVGRAPAFFNSIPLAVYWETFIVVLAIGIGIFKKLLRVPGLLLIHLGCIAVLIGAIWGSEAGHELQKKFFKTDRIRSARMVIYEGMREDRVIRENAEVGFSLDHDGKVVFYEAHDRQHTILKDSDKRIFILPFELKLNDFRLEYYGSPRLTVSSMDGKEYVLDPVEIGRKFKLEDDTIITILEIFKNLKLRAKKDGGFEAYDSGEPGSNPAIKTTVRYPDGTEEEQFAFAGFSGDMGRKRRVSMQLRNMGMVRDYFSDVQIIVNGKVVLTKTIEVNHPLHYGGYHFYQSSYDDREERYTVLSVMSDSGLYIVYAGLWAMGIGVMWILWLRPAMRYFNRSGQTGGDTHGS